PQPIAEAVLVLTAVEIRAHKPDRIRIVVSRFPRIVGVRVEPRRKPASGTVSQVCFVVVLKLRIAQEPLSVCPLAVAGDRDISLSGGKQLERRLMTNGVRVFAMSYSQKSQHHRQQENQYCSRRGELPGSEVTTSKNQQKCKHRQSEEKEKDEDIQKAGLFKWQHRVPAFGNRCELDEQQSRQQRQQEHKLLAYYQSGKGK